MKYYFLLPLLLALSMPISAQRTVRCLVLNHSYDPPRPEKLAKLTPLSGGNTVEQGSDAGIFELRLSGIPVGKPIELIVSKDGYQILGPNPTIFTYNMPADESDVIRIAIIKSSDFDSRKADYEQAIEKRIKQANAVLLDSVARLRSPALSEDERASLTKFIGQQNREIEDLRKSKDELAARLAQVDLDQASDFARLALKKFRDEGDLKAALALMSEEKLASCPALPRSRPGANMGLYQHRPRPSPAQRPEKSQSSLPPPQGQKRWRRQGLQTRAGRGFSGAGGRGHHAQMH